MTHTTLIYWFAAHCLTLNLTLKEADVCGICQSLRVHFFLMRGGNVIRVRNCDRLIAVNAVLALSVYSCLPFCPSLIIPVGYFSLFTLVPAYFSSELKRVCMSQDCAQRAIYMYFVVVLLLSVTPINTMNPSKYSKYSKV